MSARLWPGGQRAAFWWCFGKMAGAAEVVNGRRVGWVPDDTAGLVLNSGLYVVDGTPATSY